MVRFVLCGVMAGLAVGCDGERSGDEVDGPAGAETDEAAVEEIAEGLEPGERALTIRGAEEDTGEYTHDSPASTFKPANSGSNDEGPYWLQTRIDVNVEEDWSTAISEGLGVVGLKFHPDVGLGTHELTYASTPEPGEVSAYLMASEHWKKEVEGTVEFAELGEQITARFEFKATNGEGETVEVEGRVYGVPFEPATEGTFAITGDHEAEYQGRATVQKDGPSDEYSIAIRDSVMDPWVLLVLPPDVEAGTYTLTDDGGEGTAEAKVANLNHGKIEGEVTLERDGDWFQGAYEFSTEGDDVVEVSGEFDHVSVGR